MLVKTVDDYTAQNFKEKKGNYYRRKKFETQYKNNAHALQRIRQHPTRGAACFCHHWCMNSI